MSEERKYDHPLRLLEVGELVSAAGKNLEESRAALVAKKRSLVPKVEMIPPAGATVEDANDKLMSLFEEIFDASARIRGVLESMPEGSWPPAFRDLVLYHLYEILLAADTPWQALAPNPARMTIVGWMARLTREGKTVTAIRFGSKEGGAK